LNVLIGLKEKVIAEIMYNPKKDLMYYILFLLLPLSLFSSEIDTSATIRHKKKCECYDLVSDYILQYQYKLLYCDMEDGAYIKGGYDALLHLQYDMMIDNGMIKD
jgi:hypothetical protein